MPAHGQNGAMFSRMWWTRMPPLRSMSSEKRCLTPPLQTAVCQLRDRPGARSMTDNTDNRDKALSWSSWFHHHADDMIGKKKIDTDYLGNIYYEIENPGKQPNPRRVMDYAALKAGKSREDLEWYDVPPEWRLWMTHMRKTPPTAEEVATGKAQRELVLKKAAALKEEDDRQRSLQISQGKLATDKGSHSDTIMRIAQHHGLASKSFAEGQQPFTKRGTQHSSDQGRGHTAYEGWDPNADMKEPEQY